MFTGIISAVGTVISMQNKGGDSRLHIEAATLDLADVRLGDSIASNGVCLTVVAVQGSRLAFDVSQETLARTSLGSLTAGDAVNLEKALAVGDRLGGHFVSGHVDGLGTVISIRPAARSQIFRFEIPAGLERYIAEKGSICIDGTSLTVNAVAADWFEVNIIPHTLQETIIKYYQPGSRVNLEVDLIARYLERLLPQQKTGVSVDLLQRQGFISS